MGDEFLGGHLMIKFQGWHKLLSWPYTLAVIDWANLGAEIL